MYIIVQSIPALIPWSKKKNSFAPELAPPVLMREIWLRKEFSADFQTTGFYYYGHDKEAVLQELVCDENGKRIVPPSKLIYTSTGEQRISFSLSYEEGMEILKAANNQLILNWYKLRWPEESDFIFSDDEVSVTEDEIIETQEEYGRP
jgi:hypothetical protein